MVLLLSFFGFQEQLIFFFRPGHKKACRAATQLANADVTAAEGMADEAAVVEATTDDSVSNSCDHCGAQPPELLVCSGCDAARYCTTECQYGAWLGSLRYVLVYVGRPFYFRLGHKKACRAAQKQRKAQEEAAKVAGPACDVCGVQSPDVFVCPACEMAHYCGQEHQHDAWFVLVSVHSPH
jgi:hypothetical protein